MSLPERPRSHEIEKETLLYIESALPASWLVEDVKWDYGIDLRVEIVERNNPTGLHFLIQAKGHETLSVADNHVLQDLETKHIRYYQNVVLPIFLVVYGCETKRGYFLDLNTYVEETLSKEKPSWSSQETVRVRIPLSNALEDSNEEISSLIRLFFKRHGFVMQQLSDTQRILGYLILKLSETYPSEISFGDLYKETATALELKNPPDSARVKEQLNLILGTKQNDSSNSELPVPSVEMLKSLVALLDDKLIVGFINSSWSRTLDQTARASFLTMRVRKNRELARDIRSQDFQDLDLYFTVLQQLMLVDPDSLQKVPGIQVENIIQSTEGGESFSRLTSLRFSENRLTARYGEFCRRGEQDEWYEIIVTANYYALARFRGEIETSEMIPRVVENLKQGTKSTIGIWESKQRRVANLIAIPLIRTLSGLEPIISMVTDAKSASFRNSILEALEGVGGQELKTGLMANGEYGISVGGVTVLSVRNVASFSSVKLPAEVEKAILDARAKSSSPITTTTTVRWSVSNTAAEEKSLALNEVITALRQRHENLNVSMQN